MKESGLDIENVRHQVDTNLQNLTDGTLPPFTKICGVDTGNQNERLLGIEVAFLATLLDVSSNK